MILYYIIALSPFVASFVKRDISYSFLIIYFVMSLACYAFYYVDKKRAIDEKFRVSEFKLHTIEFFGGWPGGLIAQQRFRHKTQKKPYLYKFWAIVVLHILIWAEFLSDLKGIEFFLEYLRNLT
ncbi:MAG: DUF1294 domain-containing protein [Deltaproteobacteria bacterium]|nr:DUF1294 domain-containing protein [Deltaproteobacteria bacterium]